MYNPDLQTKDRVKFIARKLTAHPYQPPYFRKMEEYNQPGSAPLLDRLSRTATPGAG